MRNESELEWMRAASAEFKALLERLGYTVPELAAMLDIGRRNLQRVRTGADSEDPRIVGTEVYAKLFYHCGMGTADPRFIPGSYNGLPRAWEPRQYMRWMVDQGDPLFVTKADIVGEQLREFIALCSQLIESDPDTFEAMAVAYGNQWRELRDIARLMLLSPEQRKYELLVTKQIHLSTEALSNE